MGNIGDIVVIRKRKPYKIHNSAMVYTDYVYTGMYGIIIYKIYKQCCLLVSERSLR